MGETKMTPEAQRIAIAEVCGWVKGVVARRGYTGEAWFRGDDIRLRSVPDYLSDLNAMHEAEKVLTPTQWPHYSSMLFHIVENSGMARAFTIHATAAQRAEAFLRTLNLYENKSS